MGLPLSSVSIDRRDDILRLLVEAPDGLSDTALAEALGGVRPATVNALCRRMAAAGQIERTGRRPIRNRVVGPVHTVQAPGAEAADTETADTGTADTGTADTEPPIAETHDAETPADDHESLPAEAPTITVAARTDGTNGSAPAPPAQPEGVEGSSPSLVRDAAQAWSRPVNVQAALASWLTGRGATIRTATDGDHGPARDLVVSMDGDDVHVEITGWPPDGARTHPTTIAGDWFAAAEHAAVARRRTHPHARIVIALPDTRRYRALSAGRAAALAGAKAEVWFVGPSGVVDQLT